MKNFFKNNLKIFVGFILGIIVSCSIVYASSIGSASEVTYTPTDTTWNVADVKSALDSLLSQLSTKLTERYNAGVTQGHTDRDTGVTVTAASQILSGYKARNSSGTLLTGTDKGYTAGVTQGEANMKSDVTVTSASQIVSGYKARNASGTLLNGTATSMPSLTTQNVTFTLPSSKQGRWYTMTKTFTFPNKCLGITTFSIDYPYRLYSLTLGGTKNNTVTAVVEGADYYGWSFTVTAIGY